MLMLHSCIGEIVLSAQSGRETVIYFQEILVSKGEAASWALSFLQSQEFGLLKTQRNKGRSPAYSILRENPRAFHRVVFSKEGFWPAGVKF